MSTETTPRIPKESYPVYRIVQGTKSEFELHRDGCSHRHRQGHNFLQTFKRIRTGQKLVNIVADFIDPELEDRGFTQDDVRVMDCAETARAAFVTLMREMKVIS